MPLYIVAIIRKPTKKQAEDGKLEELIMEPTPTIAADEKSAALSALVKNTPKIGEDLSNVEALVRSF